MSVLIWTQHLLGTGHLRRALAIAGALATRGIPTTLASGGPPARFLVPEGVRLVQLDPVHAGTDFSDLRDADDQPWEELSRDRRARALASLVRSLRPAVLVTELFPFGRRAFRHELLPAIDEVRRQGGRVVCSVRDVLVEKGDPAKLAVMRDLAMAHYDHILVHGDPNFLPFSATFPHADALADRLTHTGFVLDRPICAASARAGVLVSAGGGRVGQRLLQLAAAARALTGLAGEHWHLVGGAALVEAERRRLEHALGEPGRVDSHLHDLPERLGTCRLSVSQAGYNTVAEALMGAAPMVLVPFAEGGESEQSLRAARLAELGRAVTVSAGDLDAAGLAAAIDRAHGQDAAIGRHWRFDGAAVSAALIQGLVE